MGMTITEKILAAHAGKASVEPGELIQAKLDLVLANDVTAPVSIKELEKASLDAVFDKERVVLVQDHFVPAKDIKSAEQSKIVRDFARKHDITHHYDVGDMGIEHCLLPEKGLVVPGDAVIGADSHTCTYGALGAFATGVGSTDLAAGIALGEAWFKVPEAIKFEYEGKLPEDVTGKDLILHTIGDIGVDGALYQSMEFTGSAIDDLSMDGRMTMCNMAIEAGGKNGIIAPDKKTIAYVEERATRPYKVYTSDPDAKYARVIKYDVEKLEPVVAFPHLPENTRPVSEAGHVEIDQVVIGSCTNGRIEDLRMAAKILQGKKVHKNVRCIIFPGTQAIYKQAIKEGLIDIFIDAGAAVSTPTCGPCLGGHMGILAKGERALATTNRNFVGRMGHPESEVYLCGPNVAAASAIAGRIVHPREVE
ncbi:3-isopropylmalate dehydratase, large subunit [Heliomicrobium modesticaldum Ice1]|uniref:3-isopropylmalate dehydratase large subunit n=1 Tax=Heliobacterium modesticaldum (strain ATCC 51547 / Ice1) TaxID=498761 RepID=LEUC_HELMI|nr:3-isopropylmalate dehydratase large subunit [Heliomicrobium modesticaldum]B0TCR2.1 RecName: Full=3-isopropylmalate dehydratase large subunit; AltName: Full=Alpha-IPM isomerase; Short=IPMI; AltName: Full=Isopropylmalate isomerase [Heliomicrobium modesticaldum Ice1]ABZ84088.1 3-isopropylmalate dehydratase, large subunit [Heliomicrobium modesticaldum Ice1]